MVGWLEHVHNAPTVRKLARVVGCIILCSGERRRGDDCHLLSHLSDLVGFARRSLRNLLNIGKA